jgi:hypothetical protein
MKRDKHPPLDGVFILFSDEWLEKHFNKKKGSKKKGEWGRENNPCERKNCHKGAKKRWLQGRHFSCFNMFV